MSGFVLKPIGNSIGHINLENDYNLHENTLRILIHQPNHRVNGDLRMSLEKFQFNGYKYKWIVVDSITIQNYNELDDEMWKSSLTWSYPSGELHLNTDPISLNYIIDRKKDGFIFTEIKTFRNKSSEEKELGCLLNKFNLLIIKELIKKRIKE